MARFSPSSGHREADAAAYRGQREPRRPAPPYRPPIARYGPLRVDRVRIASRFQRSRRDLLVGAYADPFAHVAKGNESGAARTPSRDVPDESNMSLALRLVPV